MMQGSRADFSLFNAGPFYRLGLSGRSPRTQLELILGLGWVPSFLFAFLDGSAWGGTVRLPFVFDLGIHVRYLFSIPVLILAQGAVDSRLGLVIGHMDSCAIVDSSDRQRFKAAVDSARRLAGSWGAELLIAAIALGLSLGRTQIDFPVEVSSWRRGAPAYWWYTVVSMPLYNFVIFRWVWRFVIWVRFLLQTARLRLNIVSSHPDGVGGLYFIEIGHRVFGTLLLAVSATASAGIGQLYLFTGVDVLEFRGAMIVFVTMSLAFFLGPLLLFTPKLVAAKRHGYLRYGSLAQSYIYSFQEKWMGKTPGEERLLGSSDIQSLADMQNSFGGVRKMRVLLFDLATIGAAVTPAVVPLLPLALTKVPLKELFNVIFKLLL